MPSPLPDTSGICGILQKAFTSFVSSSVQDTRGGDTRAQHLTCHHRFTTAMLARGHSENFKVKDQTVHSYVAQPNPASRNKACQSKTTALYSVGVCRVRPRVPLLNTVILCVTTSRSSWRGLGGCSFCRGSSPTS